MTAATRLASSSVTDAPERLSLLLFRVANEMFALELASVEEAVELPTPHGVPTRERHLLGVVEWRDRLLPVYSPSHVLGLESATDGITLVIRSGERRIGLAVDEVEDVLELLPSQVRPAPTRGVVEPVLLGLVRHADALVAVLDSSVLVQGCAASSQEET